MSGGRHHHGQSTLRSAVVPKVRKPDAAYDLREILTEEIDLTSGKARKPFESRKKARDEDRARIKSLTAWLNLTRRVMQRRGSTAFRPADARALRTKLNRQLSLGPAPKTLASLTFMRRFRRGFCGVVLRELAAVPEEQIRLYTIVPPSWTFPADQLAAIDPKALLDRFRAQLNRAGLARLSGWLIGFVHGDYDKTDDTFHVHLHALVVGDKAQAIEALRRLPTYRPTASVYHPIRQSKLKNPARQVSYHIAQGSWPSKPTLTIRGQTVRKRQRGRIDEPRHAEYLMWLDRQDFTDLVWLHNCQIRKGRLIVPPPSQAP